MVFDACCWYVIFVGLLKLRNFANEHQVLEEPRSGRWLLGAGCSHG